MAVEAGEESEPASAFAAHREPTVRVGIVSWNTAALLHRCLQALPSALDGLDATVVVVDNASHDESVELVERHAGVRLVRNPENRGYAVAMNQALANSRADVLVALNPDSEPSPRSLRTLVERLLDTDDVGLVAPRLMNVDGTLQHTAYRFPSLALATIAALAPPVLLRRGLGARWWIHGYSPHARPADVDWLVGAVHVLRAETVADRPGPYRERSFMYAEDLDLCRRLADAGWRRRLEADVVVPHVGNAAGAQAWGDRRVDHIVGATAAWYTDEHGRARARAWAAMNGVGLAIRLAVWSPRAWLDRRRGRVASCDIRSLARELRGHARAVIRPGRRDRAWPNTGGLTR